MGIGNNSTQHSTQETCPECVIGLSVMSLLGLPGNILVVVLILKAKGKKSTTTYLLLNLTIADLTNLLLIDTFLLLLLTIHLSTKKTVLLASFAPKVVANFTLALISLERYNALMRAMEMVKVSKKRIIVAMFLCWIIATAMVTTEISHLMTSTSHQRKDICFYIFWTVLLVLGYTGPFIIVVFCYTSILKGIHYDHSILAKTTNKPSGEEKRSLVHILVAITSLFIICNLPTIVIMLWYDDGEEDVKRPLYNILVFLGCMSSCLNPYVYSLKSENYRNQVKRLFSSRRRKSKLVISPRDTDSRV